MNDIDIDDILEILEIIERKTTGETGRRIFNLMERTFKYAITKKKAKRNIMGDLDKKFLLKPKRHKQLPHVTDESQLKEILIAIDNYFGYVSTKQALKLLPYVFLRPYNVRTAEWSEFDFEKKIWSIPAHKMKMKKEHIVPLTDSMIEIIKYMEPISKPVSKYVFPSKPSNLKPLSENTLNQALQRLGFGGIIVSHGFRHTASTLLHEYIHIHGIQSDAIEMQMAHIPPGSDVKYIYNKAKYLPERIRLMQWWSDYIDKLKSK